MRVMSHDARRTSSYFSRLSMIVCALLFLGCVFFAAQLVFLQVRVAIISGEISMIVDSEEYARQSDDPEKIAMELRRVVSRRRPIKDTPLDAAMDRVAMNAVSNIMQVLRQKTGHNLGNDPDVWLKQYSSREGSHLNNLNNIVTGDDGALK